MMCSQAKEFMPDAWAGNLEPTDQRRLQEHLLACGECASEMKELGSLWERMGSLEAPEPSSLLQERWRATQATLLPRSRATWWTAHRWQFAMAAACLLIGLAVGSSMPWYGAQRSEMKRLREEVASTREMVALSLLQQQSATERLRGVDYSARMPVLDPDVVAALVETVKNDPSVNVRLAAVDALSKVSSDPRVRNSLTQSLGRQESPMVQAALIDYAVEARDRQAAGLLRQLVSRPGLEPAVRERAENAVRRLNEYR